MILKKTQNQEKMREGRNLHRFLSRGFTISPILSTRVVVRYLRSSSVSLNSFFKASNFSIAESENTSVTKIIHTRQDLGLEGIWTSFEFFLVALAKTELKLVHINEVASPL